MPGEGAPQPSAGPPAEPDPAHTAATSSDQPGPGTYAGVRVLELATGVAGPYAAMFLADNGADVVKVEAAGGDPYRSGRRPVKIIGMPCSLAAAVTSSSFTLPPGWMMAAMPAAAARWIESGNGKKASEARRGPSLRPARRLSEWRSRRNRRGSSGPPRSR